MDTNLSGSMHCTSGTSARQPSPAQRAAASILRRERFARLSGVARHRSGDTAPASSARNTSGVSRGLEASAHRGARRVRRRSRIRVVLMKRRRRVARPSGLSAGATEFSAVEFDQQAGAGALAFNATGQVIPLLWRIPLGTRDYADRLSHLQDST